LPDIERHNADNCALLRGVIADLAHNLKKGEGGKQHFLLGFELRKLIQNGAATYSAGTDPEDSLQKVCLSALSPVCLFGKYILRAYRKLFLAVTSEIDRNFQTASC
jgi:hypothetical protein